MPILRRFRACILGAALACTQPGSRAQGQPGSPAQAIDEYQLKAGFVSSFASFVQWPPEAFRDARDPIRICVLGRNPFGTSLEVLTQGKVVDGRKLAVRQIADSRDAAGCHLLFVSASEHLRIRAILNSLGTQSIFSIGDTGDFVAEGGIANLRTENGRVRIDINAESARERHLRISSRLLQLARAVTR